MPMAGGDVGNRSSQAQCLHGSIGWSPRFFSPSLVQYMKSLLKNKFLFGTDYPFIRPMRWLDDFKQLDLSPESARRSWARMPVPS